MKTKRRSTKKRTTRKGGGWPFFKSSNKFKEYYDLTNKLKKKWQQKKKEYNGEFPNYAKLNLNDDNITKLCDNLIELCDSLVFNNNNNNEPSHNINDIKKMYDDIVNITEKVKFLYGNYILFDLTTKLKDLKSHRWKEVPRDEYNRLLNMVEDTITTATDAIHTIVHGDEELDDKMLEELIDNVSEENKKTDDYFMNVLDKYRKLIANYNRGSSSISGRATSMI